MLIKIIINLKFYFYYLFKTIYLSTLAFALRATGQGVFSIDTVINTAYTKTKLIYNRAMSFGCIKQRSVKYAYIIPFIFTKLNPNVSTETDPLISYVFSMFMLNFIILICFFNIVGYILSIYLVNKYDIEVKFPKLKRYINFYKTTSKFLLIFEIIFAFTILIFIILLNFFLFTALLKK
jgi:hypothetical protein